MGIGYMEIPSTDIPPLPRQVFVNDTLGQLSCSSAVQVTGTTTNINFPRTAAYSISGDSSNNQSYPPANYASQASGKVISTSGFFQESSYSTSVPWLGRFDIAIIGGSNEGWDGGSTYDRAALVDAIRTITHTTGFNPADVWQYTLYEERYTKYSGAPYNTLYNTMDSEKWGLYGSANQGGSPVNDSFGGGYATNWAVAFPNGSAGVSVDQAFSPGRTTAHYNGQPEDMTQYAAAYFTEMLICRRSSVSTVVDGNIAASAYTDPRFYPNLASGTLHDAMGAPNLGALFVDNLFCFAQTGGYYDLQNNYGTYQVTGPLIPMLVRGAQHFKARQQQIVSSCYPSRTYLNVGNISHWFTTYWHNTSNFTQNSVCGGMSGYLHGGLQEGTIGASWSFETTYGTTPTIQAYQAQMDFCTSPKKVIIHSYPANSSDFQTCRYGLGIALMDDGYYCISVANNYTANNQMWIDEFGGNPGTNIGKGWLGQRNGSRPTAAAINGCWVADFSHGLVILNPKGNGSQTITPAQLNNYLHTAYTFSFFKGIQVPSLNTGAVMGSVTIQAGDAVLLKH